MPKNISFSVRLDSKLKDDAEKLFAELGLSLGSAMNIFLRQSVRIKGLPFPIRLGQPEKPPIVKDVDDEK